MIKFFFATILAFSLTTSFAQHYKEKYGQPVLVFIETNPWLMVIGSDVPSFALYEKGQIIYRKIIDKRYKYFQATYDSVKIRSIFKSFGITDSLMKQPDYINASTWTDQPTNIMLINNDTLRQIKVYGNLRSEGEARRNTPTDFLTVYDNILKYEDPAATEWLPDSIEILATKFSYAREKSLKWNADWSDIKSATTVKRNNDLYSIYLDKKYFEDFIKLLKSLKESQAVEINGEKYSLTYRLPFPNLR